LAHYFLRQDDLDLRWIKDIQWDVSKEDALAFAFIGLQILKDNAKKVDPRLLKE